MTRQNGEVYTPGRADMKVERVLFTPQHSADLARQLAQYGPRLPVPRELHLVWSSLLRL